MPECPDCQVPENAVILSKLLVIEYLDPSDGTIYKLDLSCDGSGEELAADKYFSLAEWARLMGATPLIADMVGQFLFGEEEDGGDGEISEVTV